MRVQRVEPFGYAHWEGPLGELVAEALDGSDYDSGHLEALDQTLERMREMQARLIEVLVDREVLDLSDVQYLLSPFFSDDLRRVQED